MLLFVEGQWSEWLNYPGLEVWKFFNLAFFTVAAIYVLRKPISRILSGRRDRIQQELIAARTEREMALARVAEADSLLSRLNDDVRTIRQQADEEAKSERERLAASTEVEMQKLKQQAQRDVEAADKLARKELRAYLALRSVELARESIRSQMRPEDDTALIRENIGDLRRTTV
jgi:F0F1-type ATP synthase membrane subunit b/b'